MSSQSDFVARIEALAEATADGLSVEIDYDSGVEAWNVEIDQGIGYTPRFVKARGSKLWLALDLALKQAHA